MNKREKKKLLALWNLQDQEHLAAKLSRIFEVSFAENPEMLGKWRDLYGQTCLHLDKMKKRLDHAAD